MTVKLPCNELMRLSDISLEWIEDCLRWRGSILTGYASHWCYDYDFLPVDETSYEWPCGCFD